MLPRAHDPKPPVTISFHDVSVAAYAQILPGVCATLDKGKAHFAEQGVDRESILDVAIAPDMKPFHFQVRSVVHHSLGAIEGLRSGRFAPPTPSPPYSWDGLRDRVASALERIEAITPDELDMLSRRDVMFSAGERRRLFTAEEFVLSWSVPNLHFHVATAYNILRLEGVPLGKRDYLGHMRGRDPGAAVSSGRP